MPYSFFQRALCAALVALLVPCTMAMAEDFEAEARQSGDIITLTSGAQMAGVRVVRKTATNYKVEIVDGVVMDIPVSQVQHIDYDERRPSRGSSTLAGQPGDGSEIRAQEMDIALNAVLTTPLEEPLHFGEQDALRILDLISELFGFDLEVHPSVLEIPESERQWAVEAPAGTTLLRLFRDELPARFPGLVAVPQFDQVYLTNRHDAEEQGLIEPASNNNPAASPTP